LPPKSWFAIAIANTPDHPISDQECDQDALELECFAHGRTSVGPCALFFILIGQPPEIHQ
jgi:hypothetical protein